MVHVHIYYASDGSAATSTVARIHAERLVGGLSDALGVASRFAPPLRHRSERSDLAAVVVEIGIDGADQFVAFIAVAQYWVSCSDARAIRIAQNPPRLAPAPTAGVVELSDSPLGAVAVAPLIDDTSVRNLFADWERLGV
jgi:hypothetical protein